MKRGRTCWMLPAFFAGVLLPILASSCAGHRQVSDSLTIGQPRTRVLAVAPIAVRTRDKDAAEAATDIREMIYRELTTHQDDYTVTIQSIGETDRRIHESGQNDSTVTQLPPVAFCKLVGADAVLEASLTRFRKAGMATDLATGLLFSALTIGAARTGIGCEVRAEVAVYDGTDGRKIMEQKIAKIGASDHRPAEEQLPLVKVVAAKFPYRKLRK